MLKLLTTLPLVHMKIYLSEFIERAAQCLVDLGLSSGTINDYQGSAFHPLERVPTRHTRTAPQPLQTIAQQLSSIIILSLVYHSFILLKMTIERTPNNEIVSNPVGLGPSKPLSKSYVI